MRRTPVLDKNLIATTYPVAERGNVVFWKNYRITVLQSRLFRLEQSPKLRFRDSATQSVWYRNMPLQEFTVSEKDSALIVDTGDCRLLVSENRDDCRMLIDGNLLPICNEGNLGGTYRTLDGCDGNLHHDFETGEEKEIVLGTGVCSRTGVAVLDDGNSLSLGEDGLLSGECADGTDEYSEIRWHLDAQDGMTEISINDTSVELQNIPFDKSVAHDVMLKMTEDNGYIHFEWLLDGVKVDELTSSESVMSAATWVPDMPEKVMQIQIGTEYARRGENNGGIFEYYEYAEPVEQDQ